MAAKAKTMAAKAGKTLGDMRMVLTLDDKMVYILCNYCVVVMKHEVN